MTRGYANGTDLLGSNYGILEAISNPSIPQVIILSCLVGYFIYKFILV